MPNPGGVNQLGGSHAYGDVKAQTELTREAPISGAPMSGRALNTPRRSSKQAQRRPVSAATVPAAAAPADPQPIPSAPAGQPNDDVKVALIWKAAAESPGASPLVKAYAQQAMREAGLG